MKFRGTILILLVFAGLALYTFLWELPQSRKAEESKARSERLLLFDPQNVTGIDLIRKEKTIRLKKNEQGVWHMIEPMQVSANPIAIDQLLFGLEGAKISRVVEESPKDPADYGLKPPSLSLVLHRKGKDPVTLELGDPGPIGHASFFKRGGETRVMLSELPREALLKSVDDLRDRTVLALPRDKVRKVVLNYKGEITTFTREGDTWTLSGTMSGKADTDEVEHLLSAVANARVRKFIEESPADLARYGLDAPSTIFTAYGETEEEVWSLRVGNREGTDSYYAQRDPRGNVFTIEQHLASDLSRNAVSFLDKTLVTIHEPDIARIDLRTPQETITVVRDGENTGKWKLERPITGPADATTVNTLLQDLKEARVLDFIKAEDWKMFGLDPAQREITLHHRDGSTQTLWLGNSNRDRKQYFAARSGDRAVFALDAATVDKIFRSLNDLRDKKLLSFESDRVKRIILEYPKQTFELVRRDGKWSLQQPEIVATVPPFVGKDILWTLNNLEFENELQPSPQLGDTGLESPRLRVSLFADNDSAVVRLEIGNPVDGKNLHYARVEGREGIVTIKKRFLNEIPASLERFKAPSP